MFFNVLGLVVVLAFFGQVQGSLTGFEFYQVHNATSALVNCLVSNQMQFIVPTGIIKYGQFDPNVCTLLQASKDNGVQYRDVHFFPSPTSSVPAYDQLNNLVQGMKTCPTGSWSNRIWFDVSQPQYWDTPWRDAGYKRNKDFFEAMVDGCAKLSTTQESHAVFILVLNHGNLSSILLVIPINQLYPCLCGLLVSMVIQMLLLSTLLVVSQRLMPNRMKLKALVFAVIAVPTTTRPVFLNGKNILLL